MDIYSCGVLLFVLVTGRKPWDEAHVDTLAYAQGQLADAPGLRDVRFLSVSPAARELVLSMLADAPAQRPSAAAVLTYPWLATADSKAPSRTIGQAVQLRLGRMKEARWAAVVVVVVGGNGICLDCIWWSLKKQDG
jgi:serine/threonine protein kinase